MTEEKCFICGSTAKYIVDRYIGAGCTIPLYPLCDEHGLEILNWILGEFQKVRSSKEEGK